MPVFRPRLLLLLIFGFAVAAAFRPGAFHLSASDPRAAAALEAAEARADRGAVYFTLHDWGGLTTAGLEVSTLPERLADAALALAEVEGDVGAVSTDAVDRALARAGLLFPEKIANWPEAIPAPELAPLGRTVGTARSLWPPAEITLGNGTCALCHAGVTYDADGGPMPQVAWLGMPNTSLDLSAYVNNIAFGFETSGDDQLLEAVSRLHPDTSLRERVMLRYVVLPELRAAFADRTAQNDGALLPFLPGTTGATNGIDAFAHVLGLGKGAHAPTNSVTSLPDLGDRLLRTRMLTPGIYAAVNEDGPRGPDDVTEEDLDDLAALVTLFTIPAFGIPPEHIGVEQGVARDVVAFLETYRPQPFPGVIDTDRAARGADIYSATCAECHGRYATEPDGVRLVSFPNWRGDVETDPALAEAVSPDLMEAVNRAFIGRYRAEIPAGYSAPPLSGIWATAPYLHSGTIPSIRALLTPQERPVRFRVGGHALDFEQLGISYPEGHIPFAEPGWVETSAPGMGRQGHVFGADLPDEDKRALIEFLKQL